MDKILDTIIVGGGPGGYSAALYCARAGLSTIVFEKLSPGGQMATTSQIENYPGFVEAEDGFELGEKMKEAAEKYGAETILGEVFSISVNDDKTKELKTSEGDYLAKTVIIATGASPRELGLPEESNLIGRGVAYCATCDGMLYKNKVVAVAGGGNSALEEATFLSKLCKKVYIIHRRNEFRAEKIYLDKLKNVDNIELVMDSKITKLLSDKKLTGVVVVNNITGEERTIEVDGLFVAIGRNPNSEIVKGLLDLDKQGYIIADETTKTNIPGIFAVGDVRTKDLRQIVTAASDGATASKAIEEYLSH